MTYHFVSWHLDIYTHCMMLKHLQRIVGACVVDKLQNSRWMLDTHAN